MVYHTNSLLFNIENGCLEALLHGLKQGFLSEDEYQTLCQCETVPDLKFPLSQTSYGNFLANEPIVNSKVINKRATEKLVDEFNLFKFHAVKPLSTFLDFISYEFMISNVLKMIDTFSNKSNMISVLYKSDPLGMFENIGALSAAESVDDMYEMVLCDSPIGQFFSKTDKRDFSEYGSSYIRHNVWKKFIEQFYDFCQELGGVHEEVMCPILDFEADAQVLTMLRSSYKQDPQNKQSMSEEDKLALFPDFGVLVDVQEKLAQAESDSDILQVLKPFEYYHKLFEEVIETDNMERVFQKAAIQVYLKAFLHQFNFGIFYAYIKLKKHEIKNLLWIADCTQLKDVRRFDYLSLVAEKE